MDYLANNKIEMLRSLMEQLAKERGSLLDKDVIWVSQELDKAILVAQRNQFMSVRTLKKAQ